MAYEAYKERGERRPLQTVPIEAPSGGAGAMAVAEGLGGIGRGISTYAEAMQVKDDLLAEADANRALAARTTARDEYLYAPQTGLLNQRGGNAMDVLPTARSQLDQIDARFEQGLSPRAQQMYRERVRSSRLDEEQTIMRHSSVQTEQYILNGYDAATATALSDAARSYDDPEKFEAHLAEARASNNKKMALAGLPPEQRAAEDAKLVSGGLHAKIVMTAVDDPVGAKAILDANRERISPEQQQQLDVALKGPVTKAQANAFVSQFIGTPDQVRPDANGRVLPRYDASNGGARLQFSMGPNRPNRPDDSVLRVVQTSATEVLGPGARVVITSGTEGGRPQYGSPRHKTGLAADVAFYDSEGRQIGVADPRMGEIARRAAANGALGIGYGAEYMGGNHMHIDLVDPKSVGGGHVWGSGAKADADAIVGAMSGNGPYTSAAMRAPGQQALRDAGIEPTPLGEYFVNHHGAETGVKLAQALTTNPAALMSSVVPGYTGPAGMTVAQYADTSARSMGASQAAQSGRYIDTIAALDAAVQIADPDVRAAAIQQIAQFDSLNNRAQEAEASAAFDAAWRDFKITGNTEVPLSLQLAMGPGKLATLQSTMAAENTGALKTDPDTYDFLMMATADPRLFTEINLQDHYPNLTEADRRFFVARQAEAFSALAGDRAASEKATADATAKAQVIDFDGAWKETEDVFKTALELTGVDLTGNNVTPAAREQLLRMRKTYNDQLVAFRAREGRAPDYLERQEIAATLTIPTMMQTPGGGGLFGSGRSEGILGQAAFAEPGTQIRPNFEITDIPTTVQTGIAQEIAQANGKPTTDAVVEEYGARQLAAEGIAPAATVDDIPEWRQKQLQDAAVAKGRTFSDEQLVEIYNATMLRLYGNQQ